MGEILNVAYVVDAMALAGMGLVFGIALPFAFRLVGFIIDGVRKFTK